MKKQIRYRVFETNSSSCHSICIRKNENAVLHITFGEFGWGYEEYNDKTTKLQYILTMAAEVNDWETPEDFFNTDDFIEINELIKTKTHFYNGIEFVEDSFDSHNNINGYIDHQSREGYHSIHDFLDWYGVSLEDFIFNPDVVLIIDNDNH